MKSVDLHAGVHVESPIDLAFVAPLRIPGPAGCTLFAGAVVRFLSDLDARLDAAQGQLASGDLEAVFAFAHSVKSSAGMLGATRVPPLCRDVEHAIRAREGTRVGAAFCALREALEAARPRWRELATEDGVDWERPPD